MWAGRDLHSVGRGCREWAPHASVGGRQGEMPRPMGVTWGESSRRGRSVPSKEDNRGGRAFPVSETHEQRHGEKNNLEFARALLDVHF